MPSTCAISCWTIGSGEFRKADEIILENNSVDLRIPRGRAIGVDSRSAKKPTSERTLACYCRRLCLRCELPLLFRMAHGQGPYTG